MNLPNLRKIVLNRPCIFPQLSTLFKLKPVDTLTASHQLKSVRLEGLSSEFFIFNPGLQLERVTLDRTSSATLSHVKSIGLLTLDQTSWMPNSSECHVTFMIVHECQILVKPVNVKVIQCKSEHFGKMPLYKDVGDFGGIVIVSMEHYKKMSPVMKKMCIVEDEMSKLVGMEDEDGQYQLMKKLWRKYNSEWKVREEEFQEWAKASRHDFYVKEKVRELFVEK